ncbi:hypothetical protein CEXT_703711 [Caerostris extrusa]|uniref:Uncharacterized protein n=1 Tax=Caerostris extrusa TaxID=172846 RepID=A0AAV4N9H2_CAEEX|nr:hypothetical protein CEXT_703711 [Caerostris extrusa]
MATFIKVTQNIYAQLRRGKLWQKEKEEAKKNTLGVCRVESLDLNSEVRKVTSNIHHAKKRMNLKRSIPPQMRLAIRL